MPNWCDNSVRIRGSKEDIAAVKEKLNGPNNMVFDFNAIKPMPQALLNVSAPAKMHEDPQKVEFNKKKYGAVDWYDWANNQWGTKWNASEAQLSEEDEENIVYTFQTAWAPPMPVYEEFTRQWPNLKIYVSYDESGMGFSGWTCYVNGQEENSKQYDVSMYEMETYIHPSQDVWEYV